MVLKAKSDTPMKLIKGSTNFSTWKVPELNLGKAPSFKQPIEEKKEEPKISEAEQLVIDEKALEAIKEKARKQGFDEGHTDGLKAGRQEVDAKLATLSQLINQLAEPLVQCETQTQQELLQLAFAIARQIVRREIQQDPSQLIAIIREALKLLPIGSQNIVIALHPEDATVIKAALSLDDQESAGGWQLKSDPSIERGGCQVNTENSKIDASIDKQIAVLFSRIVGGHRAGETDAE